jgi:hypothetical protein
MRGWPAFGNSPLGQVPADNGGYVTVLYTGRYAIEYANTSAAATVPAAQVVGPGYQVASVTSRLSDRHPPDSATSHSVGEFTAPVTGRYRVETGGFAVADGSFVVRVVTGPNTVLEEAAGGVGLLMVAAGVLLLIRRQHRDRTLKRTSRIPLDARGRKPPDTHGGRIVVHPVTAGVKKRCTYAETTRNPCQQSIPAASQTRNSSL